jgi:hypothetical protein
LKYQELQLFFLKNYAVKRRVVLAVYFRRKRLPLALGVLSARSILQLPVARSQHCIFQTAALYKHHDQVFS